MERNKFMKYYRQMDKGSLSRRDFMKLTGLGFAAAVLAACAPATDVSSDPAAPVDLGDRLELATWPSYHNMANLEAFTKKTGVNINLSVFGSNEEMLAKLQAGGTGWDVFIPTNYTISTYVKLGMIDALDLARLPNFDEASYEARFLAESKVAGDTSLYAIPKNWGTTGYMVRTSKVTEKMSSWKDFFDMSMDKYTGKTTIHDYQLTSIGAALKYFGYSFNSINVDELAKAEKLLIDLKPHLFAITSDYQPPMRNGDSYIAMAWTGDALQVKRDFPDTEYILGSEGGEIWEDNWAIVKDAPHKDAAYAFLNYMLDPKVGAEETNFHGYPQVDARATALLSDAMKNDSIMYPAQELLTPLEFGAAVCLTDPGRAELWARVKSA